MTLVPIMLSHYVSQPLLQPRALLHVLALTQELLHPPRAPCVVSPCLHISLSRERDTVLFKILAQIAAQYNLLFVAPLKIKLPLFSLLFSASLFISIKDKHTSLHHWLLVSIW